MQNRCRRAIIVLLSASGSISEAPILREMVAGAQCFHNGSAATPLDAVKRYDQRLNVGSTEQDGRDLPTFPQTFSARRPCPAKTKGERDYEITIDFSHCEPYKKKNHR